MFGLNSEIKRTTTSLVFNFQTNTNATDAFSCTISFVCLYTIIQYTYDVYDATSQCYTATHAIYCDFQVDLL